MTELQLKNRIELFLILSHSAFILLVVALYVFGGFLFAEMTTAIALMVPMLSIFITAVIKDFPLNSTLKTVPSPFVAKEYTLQKVQFIAFFIPSFLTFLLSASILLKAFNLGFASFEQFKIFLGVSETAFGLYGGFMLSSLAKKVNTKLGELNANILWIELADPELQARCLPADKTDSKLWDSAVRTAGVILEERLRKLGGITDAHLTGPNIVNPLFGKDGTLAKKFRVDSEREGYRNLYAGIVGALRNPYAHRLIDPTPEDAMASLIFVDLLLRMFQDVYTSPDFTASPKEKSL